jgi:putative intracellular protease/amidase
MKPVRKEGTMPGDTVYLYVLDTMADWEPGFATAELNTGRFFRPGAPRLRVRTCAATRKPVTSMGGLRIEPDVEVAEIRPEEAALLLLPGGETWLEPGHAAVLAKAREFLAAGVPVAAICGATLALAGAGLLDDRAHTSNAPEFLQQFCPGYAGGPLYQAGPAVTGGDVVTASGTAPLEFAVEIFKRLDVFSEETLEAWHKLHKLKEAKYFYALMESIGQK